MLSVGCKKSITKEAKMDFELSDEHCAIRDTVRKFADNEIAPIAQEIEEKDLFPVELVAKMGELGFLGLAFPEAYGGSGAGHLAHLIAVEEMNRVNSAASLMICCVILSGMPLFLFGTEEQKQRWLVPFIRGESQCAFASTEPQSGSDAAGIRTKAALQGDQWVINGNKTFITNAGSPLCMAVTITAITGKREDGRNEISQIVVPTATPGYTIGGNIKKIGWHGVDTRELFFDDCLVPYENLLGGQGRGLRQALTAMSMTRVYIAGMAIGLAQGCLDLSLTYAKERVAFGQPISSFQAIQFKLADMVTEIEAARLMAYKAATLMDKGKPFAWDASLAKLFSCEMALRVANEAIDIHGGYGCTQEYTVARFLGDTKILQIGEGTPEIQRLVIAREMGC
jgi:alkylation response protein AidB-like acyl-CoA dehydrogenase